MEGTVTISIKEYERLKDLPHTLVEENKKLREELEVQENLQQKVLIKHRSYSYDEGLYFDEIHYVNLEDFKKEMVNLYENELFRLQNHNLNYKQNEKEMKAKIHVLESRLEKKKRFWLF